MCATCLHLVPDSVSNWDSGPMAGTGSIITLQEYPVPARYPVETWSPEGLLRFPLSLWYCVLPGFSALSTPLNLATCSCSSPGTADSWLSGDDRPRFSTFF